VGYVLTKEKRSNRLKQILDELENVNSKLDDLIDGMAELIDVIDECATVSAKLAEALIEEGVKIKLG